MRRLTSKRLLQVASLLLAALTALFTTLWVVRGLRPVIDCGLMAALARGDWPAVYACVDLAEYEALLTFVALVASLVTWIASRKASDRPIGEYNPTPAEHARNRDVMLDRVRAIWIDGLLDQILYQAVLMRLGMTWRSAVPRPGSLRLRRPGEQECPVPVNVPTIRLFDGAGHILLILGEPGSGKTTMMLDLARSLLEQAKVDVTVPIPVVFNLSSFIEAEQTMADWLVGEFRRNYDVPEKIARTWIAHNELALLLDGLDEVRADRRGSVVEKLNRYRSEQLAPWLVICCRKGEYAELSAAGSALADVDVVVIQPLTPDQIEGYLVGLDGLEPRQLWSALQGDTALLEVADTPLMLNVILLAAGALDWGALPSPRTSEVVHSHIYDAYIHTVLERPREAGLHYSSTKTLRWLRWLSGRMVEHGQTVFLLERMTRSWFNRPWQRYIWIPIFGLISGLIGRLIDGLIVVLIFGLIGGLIVGLDDIEVREQIRFKFSRGGLIGGLIGGLVFALIVRSIMVLNGEPFGELFDALIRGLILGLIGGLFIGLIDGVYRSTGLEQNYRRNRPNAAIRQSLRNGLFGGLFCGLLVGLDVALTGGLTVGLLFGLLVALTVGLILGWTEVIKHYTLRLVLFFDGSMPLNYVRFLDNCTDRILLRRVGGGYIFIHRTFMEHVAGLDLDAPQWRSERR
jgi:hypothetical protein